MLQQPARMNVKCARIHKFFVFISVFMITLFSIKNDDAFAMKCSFWCLCCFLFSIQIASAFSRGPSMRSFRLFLPWWWWKSPSYYSNNVVQFIHGESHLVYNDFIPPCLALFRIISSLQLNYSSWQSLVVAGFDSSLVLLRLLSS